MLLVTALHLAAHSLLVEAERFQNKGGWVVDAQFIEQMGSPYLLAHGMGTPVKMAETPVNVPATYFVYVRTYNWTSPWHKGRGPGRFFVGVNGRKLGQMVGDAGDSWQWQYAGKAQLKQGINRLSLHDATGFDGRCDAIYLSTTPNPPPHAPQTLATWREKQHPSPIQEASTTPFDLVVAGGGVAGMSSALAAGFARGFGAQPSRFGWQQQFGSARTPWRSYQHGALSTARRPAKRVCTHARRQRHAGRKLCRCTQDGRGESREKHQPLPEFPCRQSGDGACFSY